MPALFRSSEAKVAEYLAEINRSGMTPELYVIYVIIDLYLFAYILAGVRLFWKQDRACSSQNPPMNIRWLRNLSIAFLVIQIISTVFDFVNLVEVNLSVTPFFLTIVIYSMSYVGIRQSEIFTGINLMKLTPKYEKSPLTEEMADRIVRKLESLMKEEKLFMDSSLSLPQLAHTLAISTHLLSQVLNERLNRNFFNFINEHRIQEAQRMLLDPQEQHYSMIDIAHEVGFNSISAFNTAFKKHAGLSPSEFRKRHAG
jgi:AraC-like DNA-binding protein